MFSSTNGIPISFKVLPMVPLVTPLVPMVMSMVPLALPMVPLVSQWYHWHYHWYHWLPMVPLVKLPIVPLGNPEQSQCIEGLEWTDIRIPLYKYSYISFCVLVLDIDLRCGTFCTVLYIRRCLHLQINATLFNDRYECHYSRRYHPNIHKYD